MQYTNKLFRIQTPRPYSKNVRRDVRRHDRGQRPTATESSNPKQRHRRPSRRCSPGRRPRFPQLAFGPHPSRHGSETASSHPAPFSKNRSEKRSAPPPGSATHGYKSSEYETTAQAATPPLSLVRFPPWALRPHSADIAATTGHLLQQDEKTKRLEAAATAPSNQAQQDNP